MSFDLDPWGRYLAFGDEKGIVSVWDVAGEGKWGERLWESQVALKYGKLTVQRYSLMALIDDPRRCQFGAVSSSEAITIGFLGLETYHGYVG